MESEDDIIDLNEDSQESDPAAFNTGNRRRLGQRKPPFRWNREKDVALIMEVENHKPFLESSTSGWKAVATAINERFVCNVDHIGVKRRFMLLIKDFKREDFMSRYKSGTEEEITEIKTKLQNLSSLMEEQRLEEKAEAEAKAKSLNEQKLAGEQVRGAAMETLKRSRDPSENANGNGPTLKRVTEKSLMELWKEKQEAERLAQEKRDEHEKQQKALEQDLRAKELSISERKLALEKKKFEHEMKKYEDDRKIQQTRLDLEKKEREASVNTQHALISLIASIKK